MNRPGPAIQRSEDIATAEIRAYVRKWGDAALRRELEEFRRNINRLAEVRAWASMVDEATLARLENIDALQRRFVRAIRQELLRRIRAEMPARASCHTGGGAVNGAKA